MSEDDPLVRLPSARRLDIRLDERADRVAGSVGKGTGSKERRVALIGRIDRGGPLDELLGTLGRSDAELIEAVYQRFGWGGFLRLSGAYCAAIAGDELCLVRSATFGAERALGFVEAQDGLRFSTELADLASEASEDGREGFARAGPVRIESSAVRNWLEHRVWKPREATPFSGVSLVPQGAALTVSKEGRRLDRFWTFTPFGIPRLLPEAEAQAEVAEVVGAVLARAPEEADLLAEAPASALFTARLPRARSIERRRSYDPAALANAYRKIGWPVPLSEAAEIAVLLGSDRPLVTDLGMREVLGATETGMGAYVESISSAFGAAPSPATLFGVMRAAGPIDRRLVRSRLVPSLRDHARMVGHRWSVYLPRTLASRLTVENEADPIVETVTGDRFVDRRFAEILDPGLHARHRALASVRPVIAPFLDPQLIELLFSLPRPHFVGEGRIMRVLGGGVPMQSYASPQLPRYPDDHPYRSRPRDQFHDLERTTDEDRWLGLGAFLDRGR